jgi:hypothetical protein
MTGLNIERMLPREMVCTEMIERPLSVVVSTVDTRIFGSRIMPLSFSSRRMDIP